MFHAFFFVLNLLVTLFDGSFGVQITMQHMNDLTLLGQSKIVSLCNHDYLLTVNNKNGGVCLSLRYAIITNVPKHINDVTHLLVRLQYVNKAEEYQTLVNKKIDIIDAGRNLLSEEPGTTMIVFHSDALTHKGPNRHEFINSQHEANFDIVATCKE